MLDIDVMAAEEATMEKLKLSVNVLSGAYHPKTITLGALVTSQVVLIPLD